MPGTTSITIEPDPAPYHWGEDGIAALSEYNQLQ